VYMFTSLKLQIRYYILEITDSVVADVDVDHDVISGYGDVTVEPDKTTARIQNILKFQKPYGVFAIY